MNPRRHSAHGFSLIELMLAMGLFSALAIALIALLSRATDFLTMGASTVETLDAQQSFVEGFETDIATIATQPDSSVGLPDVRLYSDHVLCKQYEEDRVGSMVQRLFFTRMIPNEATAPQTRYAGTELGATKYTDQNDDLKEAREKQLKATGGLMEVFWVAVPESDQDQAVMRLYRGYRSPIGGADSLFPRKHAGDLSALPKERGPISKKEILAVAKPVLPGVLYFGVEFWSRKTRSWEAPSRKMPDAPPITWDSTRGIMPRGVGFDGFPYSRIDETLDDPTAEDPTDDTFPRRLRVVLTVEEVGRNAKTGILSSPLLPDTKVIELTDGTFIPLTEGAKRYVKIGGEWIQFENLDGRTLRGCRRGVRGTVAQNHDPGVRVHHGRTMVREYSIATFRDAYSDELPVISGRR